MYTTMDCEFFAYSYYYTQHGPQGERVNDDQSWLICLVVIDLKPKEQVGEITNVGSEDIVSSFQPIPVLLIEHLEPKDVNSDVPHVIDNNSYNVIDSDIPNRYELSLRSTRRLPLRRYDPKFET